MFIFNVHLQYWASLSTLTLTLTLTLIPTLISTPVSRPPLPTPTTHLDGCQGRLAPPAAPQHLLGWYLGWVWGLCHPKIVTLVV